jgi:hypothetical protein
MALGHPVEAIAALTKYLHDGADQVPLSRREQVQAQVALLESKLGELTVTSDQSGALIRIDDREVGRTPLFEPVRLAAGAHRVTASLPDGAQVTRQVTVSEGDRQRLDLVFVTVAPVAPVGAAPAAPVPPIVAAAPTADISGPHSLTMRRTSYALAGAGVLAGGAALGLYLWNRGQYQDWSDANASLATMMRGSAEYQTLAIANNARADSLTTANHAIWGLTIGAGALVAAGATLFLVDRAHIERGGDVAFVWSRDASGGSTAALAWSGRW